MHGLDHTDKIYSLFLQVKLFRFMDFEHLSYFRLLLWVVWQLLSPSHFLLFLCDSQFTVVGDKNINYEMKAVKSCTEEKTLNREYITKNRLTT